ncbi:nucleoside diphosphate kinase [Globomyces pollinis-pini]|nr:nucleoside diphosphate kinase [Globomyces pollinis-pini]
MSANAKKAPEILVPSLALSDEDWDRCMGKSGLKVIDIFAKWAGPCEPIQSIFKRIKLDYGDLVTFAQAQSDYIESLKNFRNRSCPTFLVFFNETLVKVIRGANSPLIEKVVKEQIEIEKTGGVHKQDWDDPATSLLPVVNRKPRNVDTELNTNEAQPASASISKISNSKENLATTETVPETTPTIPANFTETFALIKPDAMSPKHVEGIMDHIRTNRFTVVKKKKVWMTTEIVEEFYKEHKEKSFFPALVTYFTSGPSLAMVLAKEDAVKEWRTLIGPANSHRAKEDAPKSLRAYFGTDNRLNAVFGSDSQESATKEIDIFFGPESKVTELPFNEDNYTLKGSPGMQKTLCIIKSESDEIRQSIIERIICRGIQVFKREEMHFGRSEVEELYSDLKDTPDFEDIVTFMTKFPMLALVLTGDNVVNDWREIVGDTDPAVAKETLPHSIRALYGSDKIRNIVHASDTVENALREIQLVFPYTLQRGSSVVDTRVGTASNPHPVGYTSSMEDIHNMTERTLALIKPDAYGSGKKDSILQKIEAAGFKIVKETELMFNHLQAQEFYKEHQTKEFFNDLVVWMSGAPIYAIVLEKENAINAWRELAGPTNSVKAREIAPESIRALFGTDGSQNAVHGSDSPASAEREIKVVFGDTISAYPDPLPSLPEKVVDEEVKVTSTRPSITNLQATASVKSTENVLNMILGQENQTAVEPSAHEPNLSFADPTNNDSKSTKPSREGSAKSFRSKSNLASKTTGSRTNMSKSNLSNMSKSNLSNMSKSNISNMSKSNLSKSSKADLKSKSNLSNDDGQ